MNHRLRTALFLGALIAILLTGFLFFMNVTLRGDERYHYPQIIFFLDHDYSIVPGLTLLPGFHAVLALFAAPWHIIAVQFFRFLAMIFGGASVVCFWILLKEEVARSPRTRTLQYLLLPLAFPLMFLLYSDIFSLLLLFVSLFLLVRGRVTSAALVTIANCLVRQTNVTWFFFLIAYVFLEQHATRWNTKNLLATARTCWASLLGIGLVGIFLLLNGGMALSHRNIHQDFQIYAGNPYFVTFIAFFFFLPLHIANLPKIYELLKRHRTIALLLVLVFIIYWLTPIGCTDTHCSSWINIQPHSNSIKTRILAWFLLSDQGRVLFFFPIAITLLSLCVTRLRRVGHYALYPFVIISVMPFQLLEWRYYIPGYALFLLFVDDQEPWVEQSQTVLFAILTIGFLVLFTKGFFQ